MLIIFAYFLDALSFDLFFINSKENIAVFKNTLSSALAAGPRRPPGNGSDGIGPSQSKKSPTNMAGPSLPLAATPGATDRGARRRGLSYQVAFNVTPENEE